MTYGLTLPMVFIDSELFQIEKIFEKGLGSDLGSANRGIRYFDPHLHVEKVCHVTESHFDSFYVEECML